MDQALLAIAGGKLNCHDTLVGAIGVLVTFIVFQVLRVVRRLQPRRDGLQ